MPNSNTYTKYYYLNGMRIAMRENSTFYYLHSDHLGSTVLSTNNGTLDSLQAYYAYGRKRGGSSPPTDNRFTGQKLDTTGLMYYNARYYDPEIGAFISPDTIVPDPANLLAYNRYMYTLGNPLRYTDPTGHSAWPPQWWTNFVEQVQLWWYGANPCNGMASATCNAINTAQQQISDLEEQVSESVKQGFTLGGECPECDDAIERAEKVAFGMKDYLPALKIVAPESKNYRDLGLDPDAKDFPDQLLEAMKNANHIDFTITGMRQLTGPNGVLTGSAEDNIPGSTNWELRTIWDDPDLRDKTTFYRNGEKISPEDILNLE